MIVGNRVPKTFFLTSGIGESDVTEHAGSYHLALRAAGIEKANIIVYSSILPAQAEEITKPQHHQIIHGEVMETISAVATCRYGDTATAGLTWGWLTDEQGTVHGGLVCEYNGSLHRDEVRPHLAEMLKELHQNGYAHFQVTGTRTVIETVRPTKMYGTALVALCFTSYEWPVLQP